MNNVFATLATSRVNSIHQVLMTVLTNEQTVLIPVLKWLIIMFIGRQAVLFMHGDLLHDRMWNSIVRVLIIGFLAHGTGNFNTYVVDKVFTSIPQALTNLGVGSYAPTSTGQSSAAQFDAVSNAADAVANKVDAQITAWPGTWVMAINGHVEDTCLQVILSIIFAIWLLGLSLLGVALAMGPLMLGFELFHRTRGFVDQWIAKLVGFLAFGFSASVVLGYEMQGLQNLMTEAMAGTSLPANVAILGRVVSTAMLDLLVMAACPAAFAFGSGIAVSLGAPAALAATRVMSVSTAVTRAAARAAGRGGSKAVAAARDNVSKG